MIDHAAATHIGNLEQITFGKSFDMQVVVLSSSKPPIGFHMMRLPCFNV